MEDIRAAAQVYYNTLPKAGRDLVKGFFQKMDDNGDGKVSLAEFAGFMAEEGHEDVNNPTFFEEINKNKNGELDLDDVKTLYYILHSGRPLCGCCRKLIVEMYVTCVQCFRCENNSFSLHPECFRHENYVHNHSESDFMDNYALLEYIRNNGLPGGDAKKKKRGERGWKRKAALEMLTEAFGVGSSIASIAQCAECTIM